MKGAIHPASEDTRAGDGARLAVTAPEGTSVAQAVDGEGQRRAFESAVGLLHAGNFAKAKALFEQAAKGPGLEMAHSARVRARMCERRIAREEVSLRTPEDLYGYAIALINERQLQSAEQYLQRALALAPRGDHIYYALALCRGLSGDVEGAYAHMRRAIELQPRNRAVARNDPDFAEIGPQPPLSELLYRERMR